LCTLALFIMAAEGKAIIFYHCNLFIYLFLFCHHRWKTSHGMSTKLGSRKWCQFTNAPRKFRGPSSKIWGAKNIKYKMTYFPWLLTQKRLRSVCLLWRNIQQPLVSVCFCHYFITLSVYSQWWPPTDQYCFFFWQPANLVIYSLFCLLYISLGKYIFSSISLPLFSCWNYRDSTLMGYDHWMPLGTCSLFPTLLMLSVITF